MCDGNLFIFFEIGMYCGNNIFFVIFFFLEYLWLNFIFDFFVVSNGFRLEYIINGRFVVVVVVGFCCCFFIVLGYFWVLNLLKYMLRFKLYCVKL